MDLYFTDVLFVTVNIIVCVYCHVFLYYKLILSLLIKKSLFRKFIHCVRLYKITIPWQVPCRDIRGKVGEFHSGHRVMTLRNTGLQNVSLFVVCDIEQLTFVVVDWRTQTECRTDKEVARVLWWQRLWAWEVSWKVQEEGWCCFHCWRHRSLGNILVHWLLYVCSVLRLQCPTW